MINKKWFGVLLIVFGIGFLLQQFNVLNFSIILSTWWPLIIIIIGLLQLISNPRIAFPGIILILVGVILLGNQFVDVNLFTYLWPVIIICVGLIFIFPQKNSNKFKHTENTIQNFSLFGGSNLLSTTQDFKGGEVTAIFGGAEIDLRNISIIDEAHLEIICIFGGVTIIVPDAFNVEVSGTPIFGGWENKVNSTIHHSEKPTLYINCYPIFGGVEIKS